jgi:hypothetical protein
MTSKTPIKVIKRNERDSRNAAVEQEAANKAKTTQETAREMVANVSNWVNEFQQRRRAETSQAFKSLFADSTAQPTEA